MNREELMDLFSEKIRELLARLPVDYEEVQEIRLRAEKTAFDPLRDQRIFL